MAKAGNIATNARNNEPGNVIFDIASSKNSAKSFGLA